MLIDSHCHVLSSEYDNVDEIIKDSINSGVEKIIVNGYDLKTSKEAVELANKYDHVYAAVGIGPSNVTDVNDETYDIISKLAKEAKVVAIGEVGLDYYWNNENIGLQRRAFRKQILIANLYGLPIVIHTREAVMDTLKMLKEHMVIKKGVFHCCPLNRELVKEALKLGFYISFAGPVTFKNAKNADEVIDMVPLDRMLIETDSPYLAPEPNRGKRNDSRNIKYIAEKIANVKQISLEEISKITYDNACNVFEIKN